MSDFKKDDTNALDIIKSHFGIDRLAESRAERRSTLDQERREQIQVSMGNAPAAQADGEPTQIITEQTSVTNESAFDNKCPSCGGTLTFDPVTNMLKCGFCGREESFNTVRSDPENGYSLYELQNNIGRRIQTVNKIIVCGTCGGNFLAESSALSSVCPYCGSNSITETGNSTCTLEPTGVIPFKIGKEAAQGIFRMWIKGRKFSPNDIAENAQITDLTGVYIPYWVFDCDTHTPYEGRFGKFTGGEDSYTKYHKNSGICDLPIRGLTYVASSRLEKDSFWKVVSNFDMSAVQNYDSNILAGFWSESYTVDGPATWQKASGKIYDMIRKQIKTTEEADVISNLNMQPQATNIRAKYILAPIWITSFDYHGTSYRVLINGQTGEIVGTWPKSYKKFWLLIFLVAAILTMCVITTLIILPYSP